MPSSPASPPASIQPRTKPALRGVSHLIACGVAVVAGAKLISVGTTLQARVAAAVYAVTVVGMLGASALYHIPTWEPQVRQWLKRVDHASIYLVIAGTYTPFCLLGVRGHSGNVLLTMVWTVAGLGVLQALLWIQAPRLLTSSLYVGLGWMALPYMSAMLEAVGRSGMALMVAGGLCYTVGAVIYARRRPDPLPAVFGYHEIFHALVIAGCALHFYVVAGLVR